MEDCCSVRHVTFASADEPGVPGLCGAGEAPQAESWTSPQVSRFFFCQDGYIVQVSSLVLKFRIVHSQSNSLHVVFQLGVPRS